MREKEKYRVSSASFHVEDNTVASRPVLKHHKCAGLGRAEGSQD